MVNPDRYDGSISKVDVDLIQDRHLFERISQQKSLMVSVFSELGNQLTQEELLKIHPGSKGIKVSKGNELESCPFQVLDIFRDFNFLDGRYIRVLNWWGHGLYILNFYGKKLATSESIQKGFDLGYHVCLSNDPYNYPFLTQAKHQKSHLNKREIEVYLHSFPFQLSIKELILLPSPEKLIAALREELSQLLNIRA